MKFYEKKIETGYEYAVQDVFGKIVISSPAKRTGTELDTIVPAILQGGATGGGFADGITFDWEKESSWIQDEDKPTAFQQERTALTVSKKSRTVAFLFAFFLGGFGAHRFYSGKGGTGIVQLLLTLTFVGALVSGPWALIDCIVIAVGSFHDSEGKRIANW